LGPRFPLTIKGNHLPLPPSAVLSLFHTILFKSIRSLLYFLIHEKGCDLFLPSPDGVDVETLTPDLHAVPSYGQTPLRRRSSSFSPLLIFFSAVAQLCLCSTFFLPHRYIRSSIVLTGLFPKFLFTQGTCYSLLPRPLLGVVSVCRVSRYLFHLP